MENIIAYLNKKYPHVNVLTKNQVKQELLTNKLPKKLDRKYVPKYEVALFLYENF